MAEDPALSDLQHLLHDVAPSVAYDMRQAVREAIIRSFSCEPSVEMLSSCSAEDRREILQKGDVINDMVIGIGHTSLLSAAFTRADEWVQSRTRRDKSQYAASASGSTSKRRKVSVPDLEYQPDCFFK